MVDEERGPKKDHETKMKQEIALLHFKMCLPFVIVVNPESRKH